MEKTDDLLKQLVSLSQCLTVDYDECLKIAKQLYKRATDIKHIAHQVTDSKLQLLLLGGKKFREEFKSEYVKQTPKDLKILNKQLKVLLLDYFTSFDGAQRAKIESMALQLNKVDEDNTYRLLATCDKQLYVSFFGIRDWILRMSLFDFCRALLFLTINDFSKTLWIKCFQKMRKHYPKSQYSLTSIEYECMMDKCASAGYTDLVAVLYQNGLKLSVDFSHPAYIDWLIKSKLDEQLCARKNLLYQKSLYDNFVFFDWITNSPHFCFPKELSDQDWWYQALKSVNLQSIAKLHNLRPLTQKIIDSSKCWEINSVQVLEFLLQNNLSVSINKLFTMNCDVLVCYKNNHTGSNFEQLQSNFFIWSAFEQKRTDVLDWFPVDKIYDEFIDFFQSGTSIKEKQRFAKTDYIQFAFHYLSNRGFKFQKINDVYDILLLQPDIVLMDFFFQQLDINYHDRICVAINTLDADVVRHFYQPNSEWPLEIPCLKTGQSHKDKIEQFMNSQIITQYNDFKCHKYKRGYNTKTRKEMIMGVDKFNIWV